MSDVAVGHLRGDPRRFAVLALPRGHVFRPDGRRAVHADAQGHVFAGCGCQLQRRVSAVPEGYLRGGGGHGGVPGLPHRVVRGGGGVRGVHAVRLGFFPAHHPPRDDPASQCRPCGVGTRSPRAGSASPAPGTRPGEQPQHGGPAGTVNAVAGAASFDACVACGGFHRRRGPALCLPCPTGTYGNQTGMPECWKCPPGTFIGEDGRLFPTLRAVRGGRVRGARRVGRVRPVPVGTPKEPRRVRAAELCRRAHVRPGTGRGLAPEMRRVSPVALQQHAGLVQDPELRVHVLRRRASRVRRGGAEGRVWALALAAFLARSEAAGGRYH